MRPKLDLARASDMIKAGNLSLNGQEKVNKVLRSIGVIVEPRMAQKLRDAKNSLKKFFTSEYITLKTVSQREKAHKKHKEFFKTVVSYCSDVPGFIEFLREGRQIIDPQLAISFDGGQGKFVVGLVLYDKEDQDCVDGEKVTGSNRFISLLQVDGQVESHYNMQKLLGLLKLDELSYYLQCITDLKLTGIIEGLSGSTGLYPCVYCTGTL